MNTVNYPIAISQLSPLFPIKDIYLTTYLQGADVHKDRIGDDWDPILEVGWQEDGELLDCRAGTILFSGGGDVFMKRPDHPPEAVPAVTDTALVRLSMDCKQVLWLAEGDSDDVMQTSLEDGQT